MNQSTRYQTNPVVSCGAEVDGAVLYNPDTDDTAMVNLTGRELWYFLQTARTEPEMVAYLVQNYRDVPFELATEDTKRFIETLLPDFLLKIHNVP